MQSVSDMGLPDVYFLKMREVWTFVQSQFENPLIVVDCQMAVVLDN